METTITRYNKEGELVMIAVNNLKKRSIEFYKTTQISLEDAGELMGGDSNHTVC